MAELTIPVKLQLQNLQSLVNELQNKLSNLKVGSAGFKSVQQTIKSIRDEMDKLIIQTSKPFVNAGQFTQAEKTVEKLEDAIERVSLSMSNLKFSDLELTASQQSDLKAFEDQITSIKDKLKQVKDSAKDSFLKSDMGQKWIEIDSTAFTKSLSQITSNIQKEVAKQKIEYDKAQQLATDYNKAIEQNKRINDFVSSMGKDPFKDSDAFSTKLQSLIKDLGNDKYRFQDNGKNLLVQWLESQLKLDSGVLDSLLKRSVSASNISEKLKQLLNDEMAKNQKVIDNNPNATANIQSQEQAYNSLLAILHAVDAAQRGVAGAEEALRVALQGVTGDYERYKDILLQTVQSGDAISGTTSAMKSQLESLRGTLQQTNAQFIQMQRAQQNFNQMKMAVVNFMGFNQVLNLTKNAIKGAISHIQELDSVMNKISIVTDMSTGDLWNQVDAYSKMAQTYGVSIKGAYEVSQIYYQQGLETADVLTLTNETLKLAKISGLDYASTTDYMTTALRGFKMEMSEASTVVDVYSNLAANTAVSQEELAVAMSKTASSMESVGATFQESSAMIATMVAVTRESATNIGSALKSIASRYGELTKDPTKLVDEEGEAMAFNKVDAALQSVGISMKTVDGQFREFTDVIVELSEKWDELDSTQQRYIATQFAGNRQQSRFLALVSNADLLKSNIDVAENSEDVGTLQALKSLDSIESKMEQVKVAYQQFYTTIGAEDIWKGLLDGTKNVVNTLNGLPKLFGKIPIGAIAAITSIITLIKNVGMDLLQSISNIFKTIFTDGSQAASGAAVEGAHSLIGIFINAIKGKRGEAQAAGQEVAEAAAQGMQQKENTLTGRAARQYNRNDTIINEYKANTATMSESSFNSYQLLADDMYRTGKISQEVWEQIGAHPSQAKDLLDTYIASLEKTNQKLLETGNTADQSGGKLKNFADKHKNLGNGLQSFGSALNMIAMTINTTSEGGKTFSGVLQSVAGMASFAGIAVKALKHTLDSIPWMAIASAAMMLINGISTLIVTPEERLEELTQKADELSNKAKQAKADYNVLDRSIKKIEELKEKRYESAEAAEEYQTAVDELAEKFPQMIQGFDSAGNVILDTTNAVDILSQAYKKNAEAALEAAQGNLNAASGQQDLNIGAIKTSIKEIEKENFSTTSETYQTLISALDSGDPTSIKNAFIEYKKVVENEIATWQNDGVEQSFSIVDEAFKDIEKQLLIVDEQAGKIKGYRKAVLSAWQQTTTNDGKNWEYLQESSAAAALVTSMTNNTWKRYEKARGHSFLVDEANYNTIITQEWSIGNETGGGINYQEQIEAFWKKLNLDQRKIFDSMFNDDQNYTIEDFKKEFGTISGFDNILSMLEVHYQDGIISIQERLNASLSQSLNKQQLEDGTYKKLTNEDIKSVSKFYQNYYEIISKENEADLNIINEKYLNNILKTYDSLRKNGFSNRAENFGAAAIQLYQQIEKAPAAVQKQLWSVINENGLNTLESLEKIQQAIDNANKSLGKEDQIDVTTIIDTLSKNNIPNISLSIQTATSNLLETWENTSKELNNAINGGLSLKDADAFITKAKSLGVDLTLDNFNLVGDKLVLGQEYFNQYVTAMRESSTRQAKDWESRLRLVRNYVSDLTSESFFPIQSGRQFEDMKAAFASIGITIEDYLGDNDKLTNEGKKVIEEALKKNEKELKNYSRAVQIAINSMLNANDRNQGIYKYNHDDKEAISVDELRRIGSDLLIDKDNIQEAAIHKSLNDIYSTLISDVLSKGLENINLADYEGLIADDSLNYEQDLHSLGYREFVTKYVDFAGKTVAEANQLIQQAIEKDTETISTSLLKDVQFIDATHIGASLSELVTIANKIGISITSLLNNAKDSYNAVTDQYIIDLDKLGIDTSATDMQRMIQDSINTFWEDLGKLISNGISGSLSSVDSGKLESSLQAQGFKGKLDFKTINGQLKLAKQSVFEIYTYLKQTNSLQAQKILPDLTKISDQYGSLEKVCQRYNELIRTGTKELYAEKVALDDLIKSMLTTPDSYNFMSNKLPQDLQLTQTYAQNVESALKKLQTGAKKGYMEVADFYNIVDMAMTVRPDLEIQGMNGDQLKEAIYDNLVWKDDKLSVDLSTKGLNLNTKSLQALYGELRNGLEYLSQQAEAYQGIGRKFVTIQKTLQDLGPIDFSSIVGEDGKFTKQGSNYLQALKQRADQLPQLKEALQSIQVSGQSIYDLLSGTGMDWSQAGFSIEDINNFFKDLAQLDFNDTNIASQVSDLLAGKSMTIDVDANVFYAIHPNGVINVDLSDKKLRDQVLKAYNKLFPNNKSNANNIKTDLENLWKQESSENPMEINPTTRYLLGLASGEIDADNVKKKNGKWTGKYNGKTFTGESEKEVIEAIGRAMALTTAGYTYDVENGSSNIVNIKKPLNAKTELRYDSKNQKYDLWYGNTHYGSFDSEEQAKEALIKQGLSTDEGDTLVDLKGKTYRVLSYRGLTYTSIIDGNTQEWQIDGHTFTTWDAFKTYCDIQADYGQSPKATTENTEDGQIIHLPFNTKVELTYSADSLTPVLKIGDVEITDKAAFDAWVKAISDPSAQKLDVPEGKLAAVSYTIGNQPVILTIDEFGKLEYTLQLGDQTITADNEESIKAAIKDFGLKGGTVEDGEKKPVKYTVHQGNVQVEVVYDDNGKPDVEGDKKLKEEVEEKIHANAEQASEDTEPVPLTIPVNSLHLALTKDAQIVIDVDENGKLTATEKVAAQGDANTFTITSAAEKVLSDKIYTNGAIDVGKLTSAIAEIASLILSEGGGYSLNTTGLMITEDDEISVGKLNAVGEAVSLALKVLGQIVPELQGLTFTEDGKLSTAGEYNVLAKLLGIELNSEGEIEPTLGLTNVLTSTKEFTVFALLKLLSLLGLGLNPEMPLVGDSVTSNKKIRAEAELLSLLLSGVGESVTTPDIANPVNTDKSYQAKATLASLLLQALSPEVVGMITGLGGSEVDVINFLDAVAILNGLTLHSTDANKKGNITGLADDNVDAYNTLNAISTLGTLFLNKPTNQDWINMKNILTNNLLPVGSIDASAVLSIINILSGEKKPEINTTDGKSYVIELDSVNATAGISKITITPNTVTEADGTVTVDNIDVVYEDEEGEHQFTVPVEGMFAGFADGNFTDEDGKLVLNQTVQAFANLFLNNWEAFVKEVKDQGPVEVDTNVNTPPDKDNGYGGKLRSILDNDYRDSMLKDELTTSSSAVNKYKPKKDGNLDNYLTSLESLIKLGGTLNALDLANLRDLSEMGGILDGDTLGKVNKILQYDADNAERVKTQVENLIALSNINTENLTGLTSILQQTANALNVISEIDMTVFIQKLQEMKEALAENDEDGTIDIEIGVSEEDTTDIKAAIQSLIDFVTAPQIFSVKADVGTILEAINKINNWLTLLPNEKTVKITLDTQLSPILRALLAGVEPEATGNVRLSYSANGTAAAGGRNVLMGELGPEMVVSHGKYFLVGTGGAEMVHLDDDAIVFNHIQTRQLLSNGKTGRGVPETNEYKAAGMAKGNIVGEAKASESNNFHPSDWAGNGSTLPKSVLEALSTLTKDKMSKLASTISDVISKGFDMIDWKSVEKELGKVITDQLKIDAKGSSTKLVKEYAKYCDKTIKEQNELYFQAWQKDLGTNSEEYQSALSGLSYYGGSIGGSSSDWSTILAQYGVTVWEVVDAGLMEYNTALGQYVLTNAEELRKKFKIDLTGKTKKGTGKTQSIDSKQAGLSDISSTLSDALEGTVTATDKSKVSEQLSQYGFNIDKLNWKQVAGGYTLNAGDLQSIIKQIDSNKNLDKAAKAYLKSQLQDIITSSGKALTEMLNKSTSGGEGLTNADKQSLIDSLKGIYKISAKAWTKVGDQWYLDTNTYKEALEAAHKAGKISTAQMEEAIAAAETSMDELVSSIGSSLSSLLEGSLSSVDLNKLNTQLQQLGVDKIGNDLVTKTATGWSISLTNASAMLSKVAANGTLSAEQKTALTNTINDAITNTLNSINSTISNGLSGTMSNADLSKLNAFLSANGAETIAASMLTQTAEGLKLSSAAAAKLYAQMQAIDGVAARTTFSNISKSLTESNDKYKTSGKLLGHIADLTAKIQQTSKYSDEKIRQYKDELALAKEILAARASSQDESMNFMNAEMPGALNNPLNYANSWIEALKTMREGVTNGIVEYQKFRAVILQLNDMAKLTGEALDFFGMKLDGTAEAFGKAMSKSAQALGTNQDGVLGVKLSEFGIAAQTEVDNYSSAMDAAMHEMAETQIEVIDGLIAYFEMIEALEKINDVDVNADGLFDISEVFDDSNMPDPKKYTKKYQEWAKGIAEMIATDDNLRAQLENIKIDGVSLRAIIEDAIDGRLDLAGWTAQKVTDVANAIMEIVNNTDYDLNNISESTLTILQQAFSGKESDIGTIELKDWVVSVKANVKVQKTDDGKYKASDGTICDTPQQAIQITSLRNSGITGKITLDEQKSEASGLLTIGKIDVTVQAAEDGTLSYVYNGQSYNSKSAVIHAMYEKEKQEGTTTLSQEAWEIDQGITIVHQITDVQQGQLSQTQIANLVGTSQEQIQKEWDAAKDSEDKILEFEAKYGFTLSESSAYDVDWDTFKKDVAGIESKNVEIKANVKIATTDKDGNPTDIDLGKLLKGETSININMNMVSGDSGEQQTGQSQGNGIPDATVTTLDLNTTPAEDKLKELDEKIKEERKLSVKLNDEKAQQKLNKLISDIKSAKPDISPTLDTFTVTQGIEEIEKAMQKVEDITAKIAKDMADAAKSSQEIKVPQGTDGGGGGGETEPPPVVAKGNVALAAGRTLMGELGPELYVAGGHYYIAGRHGAEFVNLPNDAIVFNHLQTQRLLGSGSTGRGTPVTNEREAVSWAKGSMMGTAMASASEVLATLKELRAMWEQLANTSVKSLAQKAGLTEATTKEEKSSDSGSKQNQITSWIAQVERWYDLLQKIARLEKQINEQETYRSKLESDRVINGKEVYKSQVASLENLNRQAQVQRELSESYEAYFEQRRAELNSSSSPFSKFYSYDQFGQIKYNVGGLEALSGIVKTNEQGQPVYTPKQQYDIMMQYGLGEFMKYDSSGKAINSADYENINEFYRTSVEAVWNRMEAERQEMQSLYDQTEDAKLKYLQDIQKANQLLQEIVENQLDVQNQVIKAIEDREQAVIDATQKEYKQLQENTTKYLDGLKNALSKEKEMYSTSASAEDLSLLRRQLSILQRSGGSASQIANLQKQISQKEQDAYYDAQQKQIDAIQDASNAELEKLQAQIDLMTEQLEYEKAHGLFEAEATQIMQGTSEEIVSFITTFTSDWPAKTALQQTEDLRKLVSAAEQWEEYRNGGYSDIFDTQAAVSQGMTAIVTSDYKPGNDVTAGSSYDYAGNALGLITARQTITQQEQALAAANQQYKESEKLLNELNKNKSSAKRLYANTSDGYSIAEGKYYSLDSQLSEEALAYLQEKGYLVKDMYEMKSKGRIDFQKVKYSITDENMAQIIEDLSAQLAAAQEVIDTAPGAILQAQKDLEQYSAAVQDQETNVNLTVDVSGIQIASDYDAGRLGIRIADEIGYVLTSTARKNGYQGI